MNGKKGSIEINIPSITKANKLPDEMGKNAGGSGFSSKGWIRRVWEFGKEDSNRVTFSFKVGLAVLLVSLLVLFRAPYEVFGTNIIWSILTVAIMFECTVGATFNRGFNRALGSLMAGVLAIGVAQVALCSGHVAQPFIIGISIFLVGAVTSFMKQWPSLVPYEHGFRVVLFTYCLIIVSGYRMGNPIRTSIGRLYSIAIGGIVAILVNVLVFPIWAGEQLHEELVKSFDAVADSLEECVKKYLEDDGADHLEFSKMVREEFPNEPAYKKCQSTLNSSSKLESLANLAKWEPPHGRFRHFCYPWLEYVKVGAVLRHCAYEVMALHGVLHSEIQAPFNLRITFQREIQDATTQAANLVRSLGKDVSNMKRSLRTSLLKRVHSSAEQLRCAIDMHSYLLTYTYEPPPLSDNSSKPLPKLSPSLSPVAEDPTTTVTADQNPSSPPQEAAAVAETYHGMMRKQSRRLHSWPSREVDAFEEERGFSVDFIPRMKVVESTAALSLTTFASLLIEFVARLDHLVEAVEELARLAKFRHELQ